MKKWIFAIAVVAVSIPFMTSTTPLCACQTLNRAMEVEIGADPMMASPSEMRKAFITRVPLGSEEQALKRSLERYHPAKNCVIARTFEGYACMFDVVSDRVLFKTHFEGFRLELEVDPKRALKDVRFSKFRREG